MKKLKVKTPAKINLTLEILNKREDGFHNLQSIMQTVSLYDYLTFEVEKSEKLEISLSGNSNEIPYNDSNLIYKAAVKFFEKANINDVKLKVKCKRTLATIDLYLINIVLNIIPIIVAYIIQMICP